MKKLIYIIFCLFILVCCTGCGNSETNRDIRKAGLSISNEKFSCDILTPKADEEYAAIKYLGDNYAISTTGVIYEISFGKMFSNNEYCRAAKTEKKVVSIIGDIVFKADDNLIYYLTSGNDRERYAEVTTEDRNYNTYKFFFNDNTILKVQQVEDSTYYVLKDDGNIYKYVLLQNNQGVELVSSEKVYSTESYGSMILDFNYSGENSPSTFIRTENEYYRVVITNEEKCSKYVDIACQYDFQKDDKLTKHYDKIIAFNGKKLITDYFKIFNVDGGNQ